MYTQHLATGDTQCSLWPQALTINLVLGCFATKVRITSGKEPSRLLFMSYKYIGFFFPRKKLNKVFHYPEKNCQQIL